MDAPVGIALCGAGARAKVVFGRLLQSTSRVRLRAIFDPAMAKGLLDWPHSADEPKLAASLEDMMGDESIDWVAVSSPNALHACQIIASLEAGKHVQRKAAGTQPRRLPGRARRHRQIRT